MEKEGPCDREVCDGMSKKKFDRIKNLQRYLQIEYEMYKYKYKCIKFN